MHDCVRDVTYTLEVMVFVNQVSEIVHGASAFDLEIDCDRCVAMCVAMCGSVAFEDLHMWSLWAEGKKDSRREAQADRWSKVFATHTMARPTR